jgi:RNA polymerase sigma factor FliA
MRKPEKRHRRKPRYTEATRDQWTEWKDTGSVDLRNKIVLLYHPLVISHAERLDARLPANVELDDLISEGVIGLMGAMESYDVSRPAKFSSYSSLRITGSMLDYLRRIDWTPRHLRSKNKALENAIHQCTVDAPKKPDRIDISKKLEISLGSLDDLMKATKTPKWRSLGDVWGVKCNGVEMEAAEMLTDKTKMPYENCQREDAMAVVGDLLSPKEREIIALYYFKGHTMKRVGECLGATESWISQVHKKVINNLREWLESEEESFFESIPGDRRGQSINHYSKPILAWS